MTTAPSRRVLPLALLASLTLAACGGGGGGGAAAPAGTLDPPASSPAPPYLPGLTALAAGSGNAFVHWTLPGAGFEAALFQSATASTVYAGAPVAAGLSGGGTTIGGLADGTPVFFGLGVRAGGSGAYVPVGVVLACRPGAPVYVDASASPLGADGSSPASAFPSLAAGLAAVAGGGNLWVRDGDYAGAALQVPAGVHVYGGFGAGFSLAGRDPAGGGTRIVGAPASTALVVSGQAPRVVLDGLVLAGNASALIGVAAADTELELRACRVLGFRDRGIRLRNDLVADEVDVTLAGCRVANNGGDGLSVSGAFDLRIDGCAFDANVQEGVDLDDLVGLEGGRATLVLLGSRFFGNGREGVDVDLAPPPAGGAGGSTFRIEVRGCRFESNGADGLLVDEETEAFPAWVAEVEIRDSLARANRGAGVHVDADGTGSVLVQRVVASANGGDGLLVTSESRAGVVVVAASLAMGNLGAGLRAALGNQVVLASHCVLAGNEGGGFVSPTRESMAVSSVAYLQANPWQNVRTVGVVAVTDPMLGTFERMPEGFLRVLSVTDTEATLAAAGGLMPGLPVELGDDGVARLAAGLSGSTLTVSVAPEAFRTPGLLSYFAPGAAVAEDLALPVGSPAEGIGMTPPGGPAVDAGVRGAPGGRAPAAFDEQPETLFHVLSVAPAPGEPLGAFQAIELTFSSPIAAASVVTDQVRMVDAGGTPRTVGLSSSGPVLTVMPPAGGWGAQPFRIELHADLRATDGTTLSAPVALPY